MSEIIMSPTRFYLVQIFPPQIHQFWPQIKEAIIESFGAIYGGIQEDEIAAIQTELMQGAIQAWGVIETQEAATQNNGQAAKRMAAIALTIISNDLILRKKGLVIVGIKSFGHIPDAEWKNLVMGAINQARREGCMTISCVTKEERLIKLCQENGFDVDARFCFLEIGV